MTSDSEIFRRLDNLVLIPSLARKVSTEPFRGYRFNPNEQIYEESDDLFRERLRKNQWAIKKDQS